MTNFIDLFAGIGGFRIGFETCGFKCVFSSEINKACQDVYEINFGERPFGDITSLNANTLPDFDILLGGFPCQPFSKSGKLLGFNDTRGTLFFEICKILEAKAPKYVVLENVKNLLYHDNKNTINTIITSLNSLGYNTSYRLLNAKDFGVPQSRERVFIVGSKGTMFDFDKLQTASVVPAKNVLSAGHNYLDRAKYTLLENTNMSKTGLIFAGYTNKPIRKNGIKPQDKHLSRTHKQQNRIYSANGVHPTISTAGGYYLYIEEENIVRKPTTDECYLIMGFPNSFKRSLKNSISLHQAGNAVCPPIASAIANAMKIQYSLE